MIAEYYKSEKNNDVLILGDCRSVRKYFNSQDVGRVWNYKLHKRKL